jgi:predicted glycosyltransferase involved in capsule biosynthesis
MNKCCNNCERLNTAMDCHQSFNRNTHKVYCDNFKLKKEKKVITLYRHTYYDSDQDQNRYYKQTEWTHYEAKNGKNIVLTETKQVQIEE